MREFLLRLLGVPKPIVIQFDSALVGGAQPGSLVILHTRRRLEGDMRRFTQEYFATVKEKSPGVRFLLLDGEWDVCVEPGGAAPTTLKAGRR